METRASPSDRCTKLSLIESILQHRFATPKPLQTRQAKDRCRTAPLCKPVHRWAGEVFHEVGAGR